MLVPLEPARSAGLPNTLGIAATMAKGRNRGLSSCERLTHGKGQPVDRVEEFCDVAHPLFETLPVIAVVQALKPFFTSVRALMCLKRRIRSIWNRKGSIGVKAERFFFWRMKSCPSGAPCVSKCPQSVIFTNDGAANDARLCGLIPRVDNGCFDSVGIVSINRLNMPTRG